MSSSPGVPSLSNTRIATKPSPLQWSVLLIFVSKLLVKTPEDQSTFTPSGLSG